MYPLSEGILILKSSIHWREIFGRVQPCGGSGSGNGNQTGGQFRSKQILYYSSVSLQEK